MKNILCFGDSNTFGYNPIIGGRYELHERWTGILQNLLGKEYRTIEEGCNHRTTVFEDPILLHKSGRNYLIPCLDSHKPLDLVIICLGTNDLKSRFGVTSYDIADGMGELLNMIKNHDYGVTFSTPKILLMSPIRIGEGILNFPSYGFSIDAIQKSSELSLRYKEVSDFYDCDFFDAGSVAKPSEEDGIHMLSESHKSLGTALYEKVKSIVG